jgi:hypothetical protein
MDPFIIMALAGTALQALSQYEQGQAQAAQLEEQARLDNKRANEYLLRTEKNLKSRKIEAERIVGTQKTLLADSGIDIGFGVALDVVEDTYANLAEEAMLVREEARYQALAIRSGASALESQATDARRAGTIGAVSSILGSATRFIK